jgi:hypothetical protein
MMSDEELAHLRGVNARLFADVRNLQEQLSQCKTDAAGLARAEALTGAERDRYRAALVRIADGEDGAQAIALAALLAPVVALLERTGQ